MADYYPLIARAVAALKDARADDRAPVYERARNALMNHLKNIQPPVTPEVLEAEELALDEAIARVEAEILSGDEPGQERAEPRIEAAPVITRATTAPAPAEPELQDEPAPPSAAPQPARPMAPRPAAFPDAGQRRGPRRALLVGVIACVAALGVAALAFMTRTDPARIAQPGPLAQPGAVATAPPPPVTGAAPAQTALPAAEPPGKAGERMGDPGQPAPAVTTPSDTPALPVAQRAIFYEENPDKPGEPTQSAGRTIWRLDTVSAGAGQPPETVVRIDADFPERSLGIEMTIRRNLDPALSASHLMEIRFNFRSGGGSVKELATPPQMKQEENQRGTPLIALQVPVMENFFLVGLSKLPADVERNVGLIESANWIDLPVRLANGRLAVIALEKGTNGTAIVNAALVRWRS